MMNSKELVCSLSTLNLEGELVSRMLAERGEPSGVSPGANPRPVSVADSNGGVYFNGKVGQAHAETDWHLSHENSCPLLPI